MMRTGLQRAVTVAVAALMTLVAASAASADATSERLTGTDRYLTSVAVSKKAFPGGAGTVFLASGEQYPDALVTGAAAGAYDYPVLLTRRDSIPEPVRAELERLNPATIIIVGGPAVVSTEVERDARNEGGVIRLAGANRYDTAVLVAEWAFNPGMKVAYLAPGASFPDALSGGVAGAQVDGPVLLTSRRALPLETAQHLADFKPGRIVILGGPNAVTEKVATEAAKYAPVSRLAGADRFGTSAAISEATFTTASTVVIASGTTFPDALSGTPLAAKLRAPVLLVNSDSVPASICTEIRRLAPTKVIGLGGASAVSDATLNRARDCATPPTMAPNPAPTPTVGPTAPPQSSGS